MNKYYLPPCNNEIEFKNFVNTVRMQNKNKWYSITGTINKKHIVIKGYATWLQIFKIDRINHSNVGEQSISEFKQVLITKFRMYVL